jgi:ABC-type lipoprotein release transport system permease subunit
VRETDPLTFASTAGILVVVAALASLAPALRILRMDPADTLRND